MMQKILLMVAGIVTAGTFALFGHNAYAVDRADHDIYDSAIQSDGKIIIGGHFTSYDDIARNHIARLNADLSLDASFNPGQGAVDYVNSVEIQSDGKIIIGGGFVEYDGITRLRLARLNANGSLDSTFVYNTNHDVIDIAIQSDNKIVVVGSFTTYADSSSRNYIARLNADGTIDSSFYSGVGFNGGIGRVHLQSDGKIVVTGSFTQFNGISRNYIARLNADGTLDTTFDPGTGANYYIRSSAMQSNGKVVIGGQFTSFNGISRNYIARLNADGTLDTTFDPGVGLGGSTPNLYAITIQSDEKIIIGGRFTRYDGIDRNNIARVNADGSLDVTFNVGTGLNNIVLDLVTQADGLILVGGSFTAYNNLTKNRIVRLRSNGVEESLTSIASLSESIISNGFIGGGTARGWAGDENQWSYTLPFSFNFYGVEYSNISIGANGIVCLDDAMPCDWYPNPDLTDIYNGPVIAPLGIDLETSEIYITENADHIVIRWQAVEYGTTTTVDFELMLYDNGNIKFNYGDQSEDFTYGAIIGISNGDGASFAQSTYYGNINFDQADSSAWGDFLSGSGSTQETTSQSLTVTIGENLTMSCGSDIDLDGGAALIPGVPLNQITTCTVITNDQSGYDLQIVNDRGTENTLHHKTFSAEQAGQILDKARWNVEVPNAQMWTGTGFGFGILTSTATKNESWWGTGITCADTNQLYAGIPATSTNIMQHISYSNAQTDTTICYQVNVPSTQISGEYEGSVTYTATGRP